MNSNQSQDRDHRKSRWSIQQLNSIKLAVEADLTQKLQMQDSKKILDYALQKAVSGRTPEVCEAQQLFYALSSIGILAQYGPQAQTTVKRLEKLIKGLLARNKVKPRKSQLAHLHGHLTRALSFFHQQQGSSLQALWYAASGFTLAQGGLDSLEDIQSIDLARLLLQRGSSQAAIQILHKIRQNTSDSTLRELAYLEELQALRLMQQHSASAQLLASVPANLSDEGRKIVSWEQQLHRVKQEGEKVWEDWLSQGPLDDIPVCQLMRFSLRLFPDRSAAAQKIRINSPQLKKIMQIQNPQNTQDKETLKLIESLEYIHDVAINFETRLEETRRVFLHLDRLDIETRMLAQLALMRWLLRSNQKHLGLVIAEEYESLSLRMSQGRSHDVLDLAGDELRSARFLCDYSLDDAQEAPSEGLASKLRQVIPFAARPTQKEGQSAKQAVLRLR
ncbi:MAG: hypothetical protein NTX25_12295, partial [Proteobacteria bacterium]|nr:hypothetical protein [Pseudomonadota bacterium]